MVKNFIALDTTGCNKCCRYEVLAPFLDLDIVYFILGDTRVEKIKVFAEKGDVVYLPFGMYEDNFFNSGRNLIYNYRLFK